MECNISVGGGESTFELFDRYQITLPEKMSNGQRWKALNNLPLASVLQRRGERKQQ